MDGGEPKPDSWAQFLRHRDFLGEERPEVQVAVMMPLEDFALREVGTTGYFRNFAKKLRGCVDYDLVEAGLVADGALAHYRFLFVIGAKHLAAATIAAIRAWVDQGGVLITNSLISYDAWRALLGFTPGTERVCAVNRLLLSDPALTPDLAARAEMLGLEGYENLAATVIPLAAMRDLPTARALWVNRFGRGAVYVATIKVDFDPEESASYAWFTVGAHFWAFVRDALRQAEKLVPSAQPPATLEDGTGIYATAFTDHLFYLNDTSTPAQRGAAVIPGYGIGRGPTPPPQAPGI